MNRYLSQPVEDESLAYQTAGHAARVSAPSTATDATAAAGRFWTGCLAASIALVLAGCSDNTKYLPKPRTPRKRDLVQGAALAPETPAAETQTGAPNAGGAKPAGPGTASPAAPGPQPAGAVTGSGAASPVAAAPSPSGVGPAIASPAVPVTRPAPGYAAADPAALQLVIEPTTSGQKLSDVDSRRLTIQRLRKITAALAAFAADNASFPPTASRDQDDMPCLSWRVHLLPYLGHAQLFARFRLSEPFNSEHNARLVAEIPPVYQSPSRPDTKTNYLLVTDNASAFPPGTSTGTPLNAITDGFANTAILVEVDDPMAVAWTAPEDYRPVAGDPRRGLQELRSDGFFLGWADGSISCWPSTAPEALIPGLFSIAGKEPPARSLSVPAVAGEATPVTASTGKPSVADIASSTPAMAKKTAPDSPAGTPPAGESSVDIRREPPSEEQLAQASSIVRDLYDQEFKNAKLDKDKRDFAKKLLEDVARIEADSAGRFVLLRAARDIAAKAGDVTVAIDACDRLGREFRVDLLSMKLKALEQAVVNLAAESELAPLYNNSLQLGDEALKLDDFKSAQALYRLAMNAARRGRSAEREYQVNLREGDLRETRVAYQRITDHVHTLVRAPEDPAANAAVGRYYLLLKRDWDRGLPMVLRGDNALLKKIAESDLAQPTEAEAMVAVGDQWWDFAEKLSVDTEKTSARIRARHWYEAAQPNLGASLQKIRVEKRVAEIKREQDKAEGKQSLGAAAGGRS